MVSNCMDDSIAVLEELPLPGFVETLAMPVLDVLDGKRARYKSNRSGAPHACDGLPSQGNVVQSSFDTNVAPSSVSPHSPTISH